MHMNLSLISAVLAFFATAAHAHATVQAVWINGADQGLGYSKFIRAPPNNNPIKVWLIMISATMVVVV